MAALFRSWSGGLDSASDSTWRCSVHQCGGIGIQPTFGSRIMVILISRRRNLELAPRSKQLVQAPQEGHVHSLSWSPAWKDQLVIGSGSRRPSVSWARSLVISAR